MRLCAGFTVQDFLFAIGLSTGRSLDTDSRDQHGIDLLLLCEDKSVVSDGHHCIKL